MAFNPNNSNKKCGVFLIPDLSKGHLIPMTDFVKLLVLAHPDVEPTMIVTPGNAALIDSSLGHVQILTYPLQSDGPNTSVETVGFSSKDESLLIDKKSWLIRPAMEELLSNYKPDVVVADALFYWVPTAAATYKIPCLLFFCSGIFPLVVYQHISQMKPNMGFDDNLTVSDLPGPKIVMPVRELPNYPFRQDEASNQILDGMFGSLPNTFGIIFNTFRALESEYCKEFKKAQMKRAYFIGPVLSYSYINCGGEGDVGRLRWLDGKNRVVRGDNMEEWMPDGWEDRRAGRGLVVKGWAPQALILAHPATGAFMTHCRWNSILEDISAGMPMLTWPFAYKQFINERLLVEVIGCAGRLWDGGKRSTKEEEHELVLAIAIPNAVSKFMEPGGGEYAAMHSKAQNVAASARAAVQVGGCSRGDIKNLVNDLIRLTGRKGCN